MFTVSLLELKNLIATVALNNMQARFQRKKVGGGAKAGLAQQANLHTFLQELII